MATIIDGKKVSIELLKELQKKTDKLQKKPSIAVILANNDDASRIYVNSKEKQANILGYKSMVYKFEKTVKQEELIELINKLNNDPNVNAILLQLPLFNHLNENELIELINPIKDVDGFHPLNTGKLYSNLNPFAVCCTPKGIIKLLDYYKIDITGKNTLVIGRSNIVGKPMAALLTNRDATVTLAHSKSENLKEITKTKDIIISATGCPKLIKKDMVKQNSVIIDVGIVKQNNGKLMGDVDFENVKDKVRYITPVPGGVGPMTIACLMENTYELFLKQN